MSALSLSQTIRWECWWWRWCFRGVPLCVLARSGEGKTRPFGGGREGACCFLALPLSLPPGFTKESLDEGAALAAFRPPPHQCSTRQTSLPPPAPCIPLRDVNEGGNYRLSRLTLTDIGVIKRGDSSNGS